MANENNKPYFLLVFERGDTIPTIMSAETISEIYTQTLTTKQWIL